MYVDVTIFHQLQFDSKKELDWSYDNISIKISIHAISDIKIQYQNYVQYEIIPISKIIIRAIVMLFEYNIPF